MRWGDVRHGTMEIARAKRGFGGGGGDEATWIFLTCDVDKSFITSQSAAVLLSDCSTRTVTSL